MSVLPSQINQPRRLALTLAFLLIATMAVWMLLSQISVASGDPVNAGPLGVSQMDFEEATGVRILNVAVTAGGGMVHLRYQVVDPDKALVVHDDENPPALIGESTGITLDQPYHSHSERAFKPGVVYNLLIMNGDGLIHQGDKVTVVIGGARLEHVVVQ